MRKTATPARRFTRIELQNWRNFTRVGVDLPRRAFLVGPNASGKTNFLDAFRFLQGLVAVGGGFQDAVARRGGVSRLRCLAARQTPEIRVRVGIGDDDAPEAWSYELSFSQDNQRRPVLKSEKVWEAGSLVLERPNDGDQQDPERMTQTFLEQVNANQPFRAIAEHLGSLRFLNAIPQLVRDPDRSLGRANDPFGGDFLEQVARTNEKTRQARLRRILDALKIAVPQLEQLELWRDERGTPHLRGRYQHWRPQGAWQTEEQFSDGTLRLLALLWSLEDGSGPLRLEEPEQSLHPAVVRHLAPMLARSQQRSRRQILVSTHSAEVLRDDGIGMHEVFLLEPGSNGTGVRPLAEFKEVEALLDAGIPLSEAVIPITQPAGVERLVRQ